MSLILHLESSTKACSVALSENGKLISLEESLTDEFLHSEKLTVFIQKVLSDSNYKPSDLNAVSVASGPGSYTGLRIGVSTAKGLCYALEIPLIAINSLRSMVEMAKQKHPGENLCAMIDARRKEVYSAIYSQDLSLLKEVSADVLDENSYAAFEPFVFFGDGADKMIADWSERNCRADLTIHASAIGQIELAYEKFNRQEFENVAYFEPYYLKDFLAPKAGSKERT